MATAKQIIQDAFEALQIYSPGEQVLLADMSRGFEVLNDMMGSWSNESLTTYARLKQSIKLVPGQHIYSIGVGAYIDDVRPLRLTHGWGTAHLLDSTGNRYDIEVIPEDRWNMIGNIQQVNANIPQYLWYDPQMPWGFLHFYPIPNIDYRAFWTSWLQLDAFPTLDIDAGLPVGYDMALKRNLALELAPYYPAAIISANLQRAAERSKGNVKRTNFRETVARYDPEIVSKARNTYNIYRDTGA